MAPQKTAFFVRLDRLGDLVLSLPSDECLPEDWKVHWIVPKGLSFVTESTRPKKQQTLIDKKQAWKSFWALFKEIKIQKPQVSVIFNGPWWVYLAFFIGRVPKRCAPLSKWYSFLFCNRGLRQKRSASIQHEAQYNFDLVDHVFNQEFNKRNNLHLKLFPTDKYSGPSLPNSFTVIHPGMGGSALNWPTESYCELINKLLDDDRNIVITGTPQDAQYIAPIKNALGERHNKILWLNDQLSGPELLYVLSKAALVVAPSTGVLHLSASLGTPTIGLYSPVQVHRIERWGPRGTKVLALAPEVKCPQKFHCAGESCAFFPCMPKLNPSTVINSAPKLG